MLYPLSHCQARGENPNVLYLDGTGLGAERPRQQVGAPPPQAEDVSTELLFLATNEFHALCLEMGGT